MSIGVSEERFWNGNPKDLEPYEKAHRNKQRMIDEQLWLAGLYNHNAVAVAVALALGGKKNSNLKYFDKPLMSKMKDKSVNDDEMISEDEIKKQREMLLAKLQIMQINFENTHSKELSTEEQNGV